MADSINFMAMMNPAFAAQQQQYQVQQALAQKMMEEGGQQEDPYHLANPGGLVVPVSPLAAGAKALEKGLGGYMQGKALAAQMQGYQDLHDQQVRSQDMYGTATDAAIGKSVGPASAQDVANQYGPKLAAAMNGGATQGYTPQEISTLMMDPTGGMAKVQYEQRMKLQNAGAIKAAETSNTPYQTPQGTYQMGSQIMGGKTPSAPASVMPPALQQGIANQGGVPQTEPKPSVNPIGRAPAAPVNITRDAPVIKASDGNPLLPGLTKIPPPDPSGTPKFKTENTKTGVEQTIQDQKDAAEGNKAFAATAQSLGQEKARLDNLIQVYKDVQSGTLTAQNPEFFNKMAALGFKDDPKSIKDLSGIQNATQNHILQVIQQIKDTNANAGGGAPTRTFGSEISQLLENGESTKGQPEALWNVIGQAKGVVDHHLDMVNGWQKAGGLGNRLAGGYTMRPDDFATQFSTGHNISDYRDKALKDMGPFKGMSGNNGTPAPALPNGITLQDIQAEMARRSKK